MFSYHILLCVMGPDDTERYIATCITADSPTLAIDKAFKLYGLGRVVQCAPIDCLVRG